MCDKSKITNAKFEALRPVFEVIDTKIEKLEKRIEELQNRITDLEKFNHYGADIFKNTNWREDNER